MKVVVLENVRSAHNVGSVFRTADATGVEQIYLVGYTPNPIDRFGRLQPEIQKTSLGASENIPWEHRGDISELLGELQKSGFQTIAVEQTSNSVSLSGFKVPERVAYVFGNEVEGVSEATLAECESVVEIPMLGKKESLNISVAVGVVLYHGLVT